MQSGLPVLAKAIQQSCSAACRRWSSSLSTGEGHCSKTSGTSEPCHALLRRQRKGDST
ncbi:MAG: hypothetical protein WDN06_14215 [Asticcacaulis sp.]